MATAALPPTGRVTAGPIALYRQRSDNWAATIREVHLLSVKGNLWIVPAPTPEVSLTANDTWFNFSGDRLLMRGGFTGAEQHSLYAILRVPAAVTVVLHHVSGTVTIAAPSTLQVRRGRRPSMWFKPLRRVE